MAGQRLSVARIEGVSQERFMQHVYPQVRPGLFLATGGLGRRRRAS